MWDIYNKTEIGKRLKYLRESKGFSQEHLANELSCSYPILLHQSSISKYELGEYAFSIYTLLVYSDYFGVTTDYILWGK